MACIPRGGCPRGVCAPLFKDYEFFFITFVGITLSCILFFLFFVHHFSCCYSALYAINTFNLHPLFLRNRVQFHFYIYPCNRGVVRSRRVFLYLYPFLLYAFFSISSVLFFYAQLLSRGTYGSKPDSFFYYCSLSHEPLYCLYGCIAKNVYFSTTISI